MNCSNCGSLILPDEHTTPTSGGILCEICQFESPVKRRIGPSVIITPNIPNKAEKILYSCNRRHGFIYVWESKGKWVWESLGNGGEEDTKEKALGSARSWIRIGSVGGVNKD